MVFATFQNREDAAFDSVECNGKRDDPHQAFQAFPACYQHRGQQCHDLYLQDLVPLRPGELWVKGKESGECHPAQKDEQQDNFRGPRHALGFFR